MVELRHKSNIKNYKVGHYTDSDTINLFCNSGYFPLKKQNKEDLI